MAFESNTIIVINDTRNFVNLANGEFVGTSHIELPIGNTAQRPSVPLSGGLRYNTSNNVFEGYHTDQWKNLNVDITLVERPVNVYPANNEINVPSVNPVLEGSPFRQAYGEGQAGAHWQISNTSNFTTIFVDAVVPGNSVTYTTTVNLPIASKFYWRVRYEDIDNVWSDWSIPTEFYADNSPPTTLGQPYQGGFYSGVINIGSGVCYYLVVSPNATGCAFCQFKTVNTCDAISSNFDGYLNTYGSYNSSTFPAGNWTATRTISGYSDWYLPAIDEINIMYNNKNSAPSGEGYANSPYWSSTVACGTYVAWAKNMSTGVCSFPVKCFQAPLRAIRRVRVVTPV
jgi:hypothetical protein